MDYNKISTKSQVPVLLSISDVMFIVDTLNDRKGILDELMHETKSEKMKLKYYAYGCKLSKILLQLLVTLKGGS